MTLEEVKELLPWYATGSLEPEQAKQVETFLQERPGLGQELAEWQALRSVVGEIGDGEPQFRPELIEDAHRRIDAYEATRRDTAHERASARGERSGVVTPMPRATTLRQRIAAVWDTTPFAARFALAAQFAALAILVGVLGIDRSEEAGFTTASGGVSPDIEGFRITVIFEPDSSLDQIQGLLDSAGAEIVAGPSGQSAYTLDLGAVDEMQAARSLELLRDNDALVRYAAPIE